MPSHPRQTPTPHMPSTSEAYSPKLKSDPVSSPKSLEAAVGKTHTYQVARKRCADTQQLIGGTHETIERHLGLHLLGLARWDATSVSNLITVLTEVSPALVEITFAPFWQETEKHVDPSSGKTVIDKDAFTNIKTVIAALDAAGTKCIVTAYLSFHGGVSKDHFNKNHCADPPMVGVLSNVKKRATLFSNALLSVYHTHPNVSFVLSPSLEDVWTTEDFVVYAGEMARGLDWSYLVKGNFSLRRSGSKDGMKSHLRVIRNEQDADGKCIEHTFPLQTESHTMLTDRNNDLHQLTLKYNKSVDKNNFVVDLMGYQVWSNDGIFVWLDKPANGARQETHLTSDNSLAYAPYKDPNDLKKGQWEGPKPQLTDVVTDIQADVSRDIKGNKQDKSTGLKSYLLWRPMYNLWHRDTKMPRYYENNGERTWGLSDDEKFNGGPAFDTTEQEAVRQFLKAI